MSGFCSIQEQINPILELFNKGQAQKALDSIDIILKDYPNESLLFNIRGACYAALGQLDSAVENYEKAVYINPDYAKAHYNLGGAFQEIDQLDNSVMSYENALALEPENAEAHNNLGNVLKELNKLDAAVDCYKKAISINPNYIEAHYSLGLTLQDLSQLEDSVKSYEKVLHIKPDFVGMHNNLGNVYRELGELDRAVKCYKKALTIKPDFVEVYYNLGITFQELGQLDFAINSYEEAIIIKPDYAEAHNNLGVAFKEIGKLDEAIESYTNSITIDPNYAEAHNNLGVAFKEIGRLDEAIESHANSVSIDPNHAEAYNNLGIVLLEVGRLDEAVESFEKALLINPNYIEVYNNLGVAFKELGLLSESLNSHARAIAIKPDYAEALNNLGITLMDIGELDEAVKSYKSSLAAKPNYAYAYNNLGIALNGLNRLDEADKCFNSALSINSGYAEAHSNRGNLMIDFGQMNEALISYERAQELKPDEDYILGNVLFTKMHLCIWDDLSNHLNELRKKINTNKKAIGPFALMAMIDDPQLHRKATEIYVNDKFPRNDILPIIESPPKHKKIRIGYFSADFREHPVSTLTVELYERHDRNQFEVYAFSYGPDTQDEMNLRVKAGVDHFYDVKKMSYKDTALLARSLGIDIAVDLGGFTQNGRTGIFAMMVAPIQLSYIGYLGTMGAKYYDYLVADQIIIPKENQKYYSEKIVYLPSFQANDSKQSQAVSKFSRKDLGLPEEGFIFCCFNNTYKITPVTLDSWAQILKKVEESVLLVFASNESAQINLTKAITLRGVDASRLVFGKHLPRSEYLGRYKVADLFLDTHPYNAGTTSSDALRMGLPVLTCLGNSFASRMGSSILNAINLPELITTSQEEYESLAIKLATNPKQLKIIKDKLAKNLPTAPLYDTPSFTKHLESAYKTMYDRFHEGLEPNHIYVEDSRSSSS